jgi:hypothetical protein
VLFLAEVALGDMYNLEVPNKTLVRPPSEAHSVMGVGKMMPDPTATVVIPFVPSMFDELLLC